MAVLIPNSLLMDALSAKLNFAATDVFKVMLSTSAFVPNVDTMSKRSSVTNEVSGSGYTAGGKVVVPVLAVDNAINRVTVTFPAVEWLASTIAGVRVATFYKARGGASSADEIVGWSVADADYSSVGVTLSLASVALTFSMP